MPFDRPADVLPRAGEGPSCQHDQLAEPLSSPVLRKLASGWAWLVIFASLATATGVLALIDWGLWNAR